MSRIIALIAGGSGTGKSFVVAQLKNALIYDTDIGGGLAEYDSRIARNKSERVEVGSYKEILDDLRERHRKRSLGNAVTLAIDHVSSLHQEAQLRYNPTAEADYGRANARATAEWRAIREFCRTQDFNLIVTAHLKGKWEGDKEVGQTPDGAKNIEADMGIVLFVRRAVNGQYPSQAIVQKWRRDPDDVRGKVPFTFAFTLEEIIRVEGTDALSRAREPIALATEEQVARMTALLEVVKIEAAVIEKWFKKAGVETWAEMPAEIIGKCIGHCEGLLKQASLAT